MRKLILISYVLFIGCSGLKLPTGVTIKKDGSTIVYYCNRDAGCNMQELMTYIDKQKDGASYSIEISGEDVSDKY